jgi:hypothetical protein
MGSASLSSVRAKIDRAEHHLRDIDATLKVVLGAEQNARVPSIYEFDSDRKQLIVKHAKFQPIDPALPLMVGDCIHNLRSALDHLVYQLALLEPSTSIAAANKTFFPIYLTKTEFDKRVEKLVKPFISSAALTEIEKSQPYSAYDVPEEADIWILSKLDILDKHRLLVVAAQKFCATDFTVSVPEGERMEVTIAEPKWKPMKDGAEIIRFDLSQMPNPPKEMNVHVNMMTTIQFIDTGLACDGVIVQDALRQCVGIVEATVLEFGKMFFGE